MSAVGISPEEADGLRANVVMALTKSVNDAIEKLNDNLEKKLAALGEKIDDLKTDATGTAVAVARAEERVRAIEQNCAGRGVTLADLIDRVDEHHAVIMELSGQKKILRVLVPVSITGILALVGIWLRGWLRGKGIEVGGP